MSTFARVVVSFGSSTVVNGRVVLVVEGAMKSVMIATRDNIAARDPVTLHDSTEPSTKRSVKTMSIIPVSSVSEFSG